MTAEATRRPAKRFAPLDPVRGNPHKAPPLKGIVFDVDGTLWYALSVSPLCPLFLSFQSMQEEEQRETVIRLILGALAYEFFTRYCQKKK